MRKFADKLRNFSTTPTPESKLSGGRGHRHRRHSTLSASATHMPATSSLNAVTPAVATPESSWAGSSLSPEIAPQRLLGQFGNTPQSTAKQGYASQHHRRHQTDIAVVATAAATADRAEPPPCEPAAGNPATAVAGLDAAVATAGLRQGSEGQMMLLPKGVEMNDLLALAEEMDPDTSPAKKGKREKRMLTADSTMQLAAYLASKVTNSGYHKELYCLSFAFLSLVQGDKISLIVTPPKLKCVIWP